MWAILFMIPSGDWRLYGTYDDEGDALADAEMVKRRSPTWAVRVFEARHTILNDQEAQP